jgi:hypothetical protein
MDTYLWKCGKVKKIPWVRFSRAELMLVVTMMDRYFRRFFLSEVLCDGVLMKVNSRGDARGIQFVPT